MTPLERFQRRRESTRRRTLAQVEKNRAKYVEIKELLDDGKSPGDIQRELGVSQTMVYTTKRLIKLGVI